MHRLRREYRLLILFISLFIILGCKSCVPLDLEFDLVAAPSTFTGAGEVITYSYSVKNTNYRYFDFSITDDKLGAVPCQSTRLEAGAAVTCQLSYTTTEQDVAAGVIRNNASAKGVFQGGQVGWFDVDPLEGAKTDSAEVVYALAKCQLDLQKSASPTTYLAAGELIQYTYTIHNVGSAEAIGPFAVADDKIDGWACDDMGAAVNLCVGCVMTCRGSYMVKASDVGSNITNTAQVQGMCASANQVVRSNPASATVHYLMPTPTSQAVQPQLTITAGVNQPSYSKTSEVIVYTYTVQNTGQAAVNGPFELVDEKADQWECDSIDSLPVGGQLICKGYYRIRESDLCSSVTNVAYVKGTSQGDVITSNPISVTLYSSRNCNKPESDEPEPTNPEQPPPPIIILPWD